MLSVLAKGGRQLVPAAEVEERDRAHSTLMSWHCLLCVCVLQWDSHALLAASASPKCVAGTFSSRGFMRVLSTDFATNGPLYFPLFRKGDVHIVPSCLWGGGGGGSRLGTQGRRFVVIYVFSAKRTWLGMTKVSLMQKLSVSGDSLEKMYNVVYFVCQ
jgi:hypothetical protein